MSVRLADWVHETGDLLRQAGIECGARDARLLAAAGCGLSMEQVLAESHMPLSAADLARLDGLRRRRMAREPVARILGRRGFMDLELEITPDTLDPRADTETLVEAVLGLLATEDRLVAPLAIADLGTGSGAILIALLRDLPAARGLGIDISAAALQVAQRNAVQCGVAGRASWRHGNWLDGLGLDGVAQTFDVIVSNPPYIPTAEIAGLYPEVRCFDPPLALDGGADGLAAYRQIMAAAGRYLTPRGWLVLEVGAGQADAVAALLRATGWDVDQAGIRLYPDLAGHLRCVAVQHHIVARA